MEAVDTVVTDAEWAITFTLGGDKFTTHFKQWALLVRARGSMPKNNRLVDGVDWYLLERKYKEAFGLESSM